MDYLITGGLGFIGKNLIHLLKQNNANFIIVDKFTGTDLSKTPIKPFSCKKVIHLAAFTNVRESIKNPKLCYLSNIKSTLNVIDFCIKSNSELIFTSSIGAPDSLSPYSASKLSCESLITSYIESFGLKASILRLSNVYGPYSIHKTSVVAKFIKNCINKKSLVINGSGDQTRDFIYINDVCNELLSPKSEKLTLISSGQTYSIKNIALLISTLSEKYLNYKPQIIHKEPIKGEIEKIETKSENKNSMLFTRGLETTFKWFTEHYKPTKQLV